MKTNNESPKGAMKGSFGKNEKQSKSMTSVGDKKKGMAKRMKEHDVSARSLPMNVRHSLGSAIPEHVKERFKKTGHY